tara:strand:- start:98 stop:346 length:249 start_codon:yes stop_codon:yes gene_type:complete
MIEDEAINNIREVTLPIASVGACRNNRNCKNYQVVLGNGLCMNCYDRGLDNRYLKQEVRREGKTRYGTNAVGTLQVSCKTQE